MTLGESELHRMGVRAARAFGGTQGRSQYDVLAGVGWSGGNGMDLVQWLAIAWRFRFRQMLGNDVPDKGIRVG